MHNELFAFEAAFVVTLRCVPMAVRFKLDRVGIKLTLRQWSRMTRSDREDLRNAACISDAEVSTYREFLCDLIRRRSAETPRLLDQLPSAALWSRSRVPDDVCRQAELQGLPAPSAVSWSSLPELRRFVLLKLSRDNHDNINFGPALREFGLLIEEPMPV